MHLMGSDRNLPVSDGQPKDKESKGGIGNDVEPNEEGERMIGDFCNEQK